MNRKGLFTLALVLVFAILGLIPAYADGYTTAKTGNYPASVGITGVDEDGNKIIYGSGSSGETAPTKGLFPICGKGSDGKSYTVSVGTDGKIAITLSGSDLGSTIGTNVPPKGVMIAGKDASGYLRAVYVAADGTVYISGEVVITSASYGTAQGSNHAPDEVGVFAGKTSTGNYIVPLVGTDGKTVVTIAANDFGSPRGTNVPTNGIMCAGIDSSGYLRAIYVKADGTVYISGEVTIANGEIEVIKSSFGTTQGSSNAPDEVAVVSGKSAGGSYLVLKVADDGRLIAYGAVDDNGNFTLIKTNSDGNPLFRFADANAVTLDDATTDKVAVVTPGAGNSLVIERFSVSMQNAGLIKFYLGNDVKWQAYLPAGGYADAGAGTPYFGTADAAASVQSTSTNATINIQYRELSP
jgi:hypothetical protein